MAVLKVHWMASEKLMKEELGAAGKTSPAAREFEIDLEALDPQERKALVQLVGVGSMGVVSALDIRCKPRLDSYNYEDTPLDAQPGVAQVIQVAGEIAQRKAQIAEQRKQEEVQKAAKFRTAKEYISRVCAEVKALRDAKDLQGLLAYRYPQPCPDLSPVRNDVGLDGAIAELRKERAEAEKRAWIEAHGSEHLKRAFGKGYDCQRLYVVERAAIEASGFTVDYNDSAEWKARACPSSEGLDAEDAAHAIAEALGLGEPETVWLTAGPEDRTAREEYDEEEPFEACEAIVLRKYLGKYDLVKVL